MEMWMVYALGGSLTIGIYGFLQKIEAESDVNRNSFIFYSHFGMIVYPLLYLLVTGSKIDLNIQIIFTHY